MAYGKIDINLTETTTFERILDQRNSLLEACKTVVSGYEADGMEGMRPRDEVFYRVCKAAIAKAEGATQPQSDNQ